MRPWRVIVIYVRQVSATRLSTDHFAARVKSGFTILPRRRIVKWVDIAHACASVFAPQVAACTRTGCPRKSLQWYAWMSKRSTWIGSLSATYSSQIYPTRSFLIIPRRWRIPSHWNRGFRGTPYVHITRIHYTEIYRTLVSSISGEGRRRCETCANCDCEDEWCEGGIYPF